MKRQATFSFAAICLLALVLGIQQWVGSENQDGPATSAVDSNAESPSTPTPTVDATLEDPSESGELRVPPPPTPLPQSDSEDAEPQMFVVRVLDPGEQAVMGATVSWVVGEDELEGRTNEEGVASFPLPDPPTLVHLRARYRDLDSFPQRTPSVRGSATLRLAAFDTLGGRVVDDRTGEPITGAMVAIRSSQPSVDEKTTSGEDGRFVFEGIPMGTRLLASVLASGYPPRLVETSTPEAQNGLIPELEIRLEAGIQILGVVTDAVTGAPLPEAKLHALVANGGGEVRVDSEGRFDASRFTSREEQALEFLAEAEGYCSMHRKCDAGDWEHPVRIRMIPSAEIHVTCVDGNGVLLEGVRLSTRTLSFLAGHETPAELNELVGTGWKFGGSRLGRPGADFETRRSVHSLVRIPHAPPVQVTARSAELGSIPVTLPAAGPPGSTQTLELRLTESMGDSHSTRIRGTLAINGQPAPGIMFLSQGRTRGASRIAPDGSFDFKNLQPGSGLLRPAPSLGAVENLGPYFTEGMPFADECAQVSLVDGEVTEVDLDITIPLGILEGRVVDSDGRPLVGHGVRVATEHEPLDPTVQPGLSPLARGTTDSDGRFSISVPVALSPFRVSVTLGSESQTLHVPSAPSSGLDFESPRTRAVLIRANRKGRGPIGSMLQVHVRPEGSNEYHRVEQNHPLRKSVDLSGERVPVFLFDLPLGNYDLLIGRPWELPKLQGPIELTDADTPYEIDAELDSGHRIEILLDEGVDPIPEGLTILLVEEAHWDSVRDPERIGGAGDPYPATTPGKARGLRRQDNSLLTQESLPPGRYRFKVFPPDIKIEPEWIEMGSSDQRVEIRWE